MFKPRFSLLTLLLACACAVIVTFAGIMALILQNHCRDFISGREMDFAAYQAERIDIHHIFPKYYCEKQKLPKEKYMGCSAWFFLIINWTKMPLFLMDGRITLEALKVDLTMIPFLLVGGALGILLISKMPQKLFENIIQVIVVLCAIYLFF